MTTESAGHADPTQVGMADVEAVIDAYLLVIREHHAGRDGVRLADELRERLRERSGDAAALRREILDRVALDEGLDLKELAEVAGGVTVQRAWQLRKQARERAEKGSDG